MKRIELKRKDPFSQQHFVLVDDEDYLEMQMYSWSVHDGRKYYKSTTLYARSTINGKTVYMHHMLLPNDDPKLIRDHIDGNGLNNQRHNLRLVDRSSSTQNSPIRFDNESGYRGVSYRKDRKKWRAYMNEQHLGYFETAEDAARAYNKKAKEAYGESARLNDIPDSKQ